MIAVCNGKSPLIPICLIVPLARHDVSHATTGILDIPFSSRNQVDVAVADGLTCGLAIIDSNVEVSDCWIQVDDTLPCGAQEHHAGIDLGACKVKKAR